MENTRNIIKKIVKEYFDNLKCENLVIESNRRNIERLKSLNDIGQKFKCNTYLPEGIDFNKYSKEVWYDSKTEDYVSTSTDTNPTINSGFGNISVWSVFKRDKIDQKDKLDGNPLLYAYKNENGWKFRSRNDRLMIERQIISIINKFNSTHKYGTTVVVPTGSMLNDYLGNLVKNSNPQSVKIDNLLYKISTDEVYEDVTSFGSYFRKVYKDENSFNDAINQLETFMGEMDRKRGGYFTYHFIKDPKMRKTIERTLKICKNPSRFSEYINDKDVLVVDDSISQGNTIREVCNIIQETFVPKTLTVLTLFSRI